MADISAVAQTYSNAGAAITASYPGANWQVVGTSNLDNFGTRNLSFLKIAGTKSSSAVDISSAAFRAAVVRGVQQYAEMYGFGATDASSPYDVVAIVADDTANGSEVGSNVDATTFGKMEAAILAAVNGVTAATLDAVVVTRYAGFSGDIIA